MTDNEPSEEACDACGAVQSTYHGQNAMLYCIIWSGMYGESLQGEDGAASNPGEQRPTLSAPDANVDSHQHNRRGAARFLIVT